MLMIVGVSPAVVVAVRIRIPNTNEKCPNYDGRKE